MSGKGKRRGEMEMDREDGDGGERRRKVEIKGEIKKGVLLRGEAKERGMNIKKVGNRGS